MERSTAVELLKSLKESGIKYFDDNPFDPVAELYVELCRQGYETHHKLLVAVGKRIRGVKPLRPLGPHKMWLDGLCEGNKDILVTLLLHPDGVKALERYAVVHRERPHHVCWDSVGFAVEATA